MPSVSRQQPSAVRPQNGQTGGASQGILSQAVAVADIDDDFVNMVLYGQNRTGKTTLACQFPKPLLIISFEPGNTGGATSVKRMPGVKFIRITSKMQAVNLAKELHSADGGICDLPDFRGKRYATHVLDTCTSLQDVILAELMDLENAPVQLNWGAVPEDYYRERSEQAKEVMRLYRNIPVHTIFVAQERDHNPPKQERNKLIRGLQTESAFAADMGAATVKWMHDACDYIGQLYVVKERAIREYKSRDLKGKETVERREEETGLLTRRLRTMIHPNYAAGFRSCTPECVPAYIEDRSPEGMYKKIMAVVDGTYVPPKSTLIVQ